MTYIPTPSPTQNAGSWSRAMTPNGTLLAMVAFAAVATFGVLTRPLLPVDETRYLAVAWEMHINGNWLVPRLNGALYAHKPPLLFWLINLVWAVFGVSETAARLIGPAFGTAAIGLTSLLARRLWPLDPRIGHRAALILAGFGSYAVYASLTMFDAMLTTAVLLGVLALTGRDRRRWLWFGLALALGAFAKGPVILIHLLPVALSAPLWTDMRPRDMLRGLGLALLTGLACVGLWLVPAILIGGPDYRDAVLWTQSAGRVGGTLGHGRAWWFLLALSPLILWPWAWSPRLWRDMARLDTTDPGFRLCAIWATAALVLFTFIGGKQAHYLLPTLPAVALLAARAMGESRHRIPLAGLIPLILGIAALTLSLGLIPGDDTATLAQPGWAVALLGGLLILLAGTALALRGAAPALLGLGLAALSSLAFALAAPGRIYDAAPMAALIAPHDASGIALLGQTYNGEFTFAARLRHPLTEIADLPAAQAWLDRTPGGLLIVPLDRDAPTAPPSARVLYRNHPYGLWSNDRLSDPEPAPDTE